MERARPLAAAAEFGRVYLVKGEWNAAFLREAGSFPTNKRDQIDAVDGAYKMLCVLRKVWPELSMDAVRKFSINWDDSRSLKKGLHYGAISHAQDNTAAYVAAFYDPILNQLYVYDCAMWSLGPATVAQDLVVRARLKNVGMARLIGSDSMFTSGAEVGAAALINRELSKARVPVRVTKAFKYDEMGAIAFLGQMFDEARVVISPCAEAVAMEAIRWSIDEGSGRPERGRQHATALCMIASELRERVAATRAKKRVDYAPVQKEVKADGGWMSA